MASKSTISISFELKDGKDGLKTLSLNVKDLQKFLGATVTEADKLNKKFINFAALATGVDSINNTLQSFQTALKGLSDIYAKQVEAETKLANNMRNTMDARDEDIQSIKDLCSAQQKLGVIGDEVQLAGAQELTTYLTKRESLEKLIPVMNDMLAQQYGLNATQENAANIATMLGKVMDGQTGALKRYGYTFDDAQEAILKFGDESQRAAVLCEVVSGSVGGMNAELAKTDVGKQKQLENTLGDIKERIGGLIQPIAYATTQLGSFLIAAGAIFKFANGVRTACAIIKSFNTAQKAMSVVALLATGRMDKGAMAIRAFGNASKSATARTIAFKFALQALTSATVIGAALTAVVLVVGKLTDAFNKGAEASEKFAKAQEYKKRLTEDANDLAEEENRTRANTTSLLELNITKLKEFNGAKADEKKLVKEMNDTYGDTMGYFASVADWYKALTENSETYCRQMVLEAKTRKLASQIADAEMERDNAQKELDSGKLSKKRNTPTTKEIASAIYDADGRVSYTYQTKEIIGSSEYEQQEKKVDDLTKHIEGLKNGLTEATKEASKLSFKVQGSSVRPDASGAGKAKGKKGSLKYYTDKLTELKTKYELAIDPESRAKVQKEIDEIEFKKHKIELQLEVRDLPGFYRDTKGQLVRNTAELTKELNKEVKEKFKPDILKEIPKNIKLADTHINTNTQLDADAKAFKARVEELKKLNEQITISETLTGALATAFGGLGEAIGGATGEFVSFAAKSMQAISEIIPQIVALIGIKESEAIASGTASGAGLPFPANIAAIASIIATVSGVFASLPKFANGGIISGPTVGLMGEYAGASNNPEVVAPLDKLRSLIAPSDNHIGGNVKFRIEGRSLVGVLEREHNLKSRS